MGVGGREPHVQGNTVWGWGQKTQTCIYHVLPATCQKIQDGQDRSCQLLTLDFWLPSICQTITFCCLSMVFCYVNPRKLIQLPNADHQRQATPPPGSKEKPQGTSCVPFLDNFSLPGCPVASLPLKPCSMILSHRSIRCHPLLHVSGTQSEFSAWKHRPWGSNRNTPVWFSHLCHNSLAPVVKLLLILRP